MKKLRERKPMSKNEAEYLAGIGRLLEREGFTIREAIQELEPRDPAENPAAKCVAEWQASNIIRIGYHLQEQAERWPK